MASPRSFGNQRIASTAHDGIVDTSRHGPSARRVMIVGAGALGLRVARACAQLGDEVIAVRRSAAPTEDGLRWLQADVTNGRGFERLPTQVDALVYCVTPDERSEPGYRRTFVEGLLRVAGHVVPRRLLLASSTAVYGEATGEWVDEDSATEPASFRGHVMLDAERSALEHGDATVVRFSELYGEGRTRAIRRAASGEPGRRCWTNRIHLDDAADAVVQALHHAAPPRVLAASDDVPLLEADLWAWLREPAGRPPDPDPATAAEGRRVRNDRLRSLGWVPRYPDGWRGYAALLGPLAPRR